MMDIKAVLFDLDDTLLGNNMNTFLPGYFGRMGEYVAPVIDPERLIAGLLWATDKMAAEPDLTRRHSNRDRFWRNFEERLGLNAAEQEPFFARFYAEIFPQLAPLTQRKEVAVPLVEYCFAQGWQVVIATNPLFPQTAIEQRLAWAGLPVEKYPFALVTSFEVVHAAKPHTAYYAEILDRIGVGAGEAIMVGDDWQNDIQPAHELGMHAYWIQLEQPGPSDAEMVVGWGTLAEFYDGLREGAWA